MKIIIPNNQNYEKKHLILMSEITLYLVRAAFNLSHIF